MITKKQYENDDLNPNYMFQTTANTLLVQALSGEYNILEMVRKELANQGLDTHGKWVGFAKAKEVHNIK